MVININLTYDKDKYPIFETTDINQKTLMLIKLYSIGPYIPYWLFPVGYSLLAVPWLYISSLPESASPLSAGCADTVLGMTFTTASAAANPLFKKPTKEEDP